MTRTAPNKPASSPLSEIHWRLPTELWNEIYSFLSLKDKYRVFIRDRRFYRFLLKIKHSASLESLTEAARWFWKVNRKKLRAALRRKSLTSQLYWGILFYSCTNPRLAARALGRLILQTEDCMKLLEELVGKISDYRLQLESSEFQIFKNYLPLLASVSEWAILNVATQDRTDVRHLPILNQLRGLTIRHPSIAVINEVDIASCMYSSVEVVHLAQLTNLRALDLQGAYIKDIRPLTALAKLRVLKLVVNCNGIEVGWLNLEPLLKLRQLQVLSLAGPFVTSLDVISSLTNLLELSLNYNRIHDLSPIAALRKLQKLSLVKTRVKDLRPIYGLTNLQVLCLNKSPVDDVTPLAGLLNLSALFT